MRRSNGVFGRASARCARRRMSILELSLDNSFSMWRHLHDFSALAPLVARVAHRSMYILSHGHRARRRDREVVDRIARTRARDAPASNAALSRAGRIHDPTPVPMHSYQNPHLIAGASAHRPIERWTPRAYSRERQNRERAKPRLFSSLFARLISSTTPSAPTLPRSCARGSMQYICLRPSLASQRVMECGTTMKTPWDSINRVSRRRRRLRVRAIGDCYFTLRRATSEVVG
jgi:hypothetical protein